MVTNVILPTARVRDCQWKTYVQVTLCILYWAEGAWDASARVVGEKVGLEGQFLPRIGGRLGVCVSLRNTGSLRFAAHDLGELGRALACGVVSQKSVWDPRYKHSLAAWVFTGG